MRKRPEEFRRCKEVGCSKPAAPKRTICYTCKSRQFAKAHPVKRVFYDLRHSATRRNIEFSLTLPEFEVWIAGTDYMQRRGRLWDNFTIDRRKNTAGYSLGNIQLLSKSNNSKKFWKRWRKEKRELDKAIDEHLESVEEIEEEDLPF